MTFPPPEKAIRRFCIACQGGAIFHVPGCADTACVLHVYRQGIIPQEPSTAALRAIRRFCHACAGSRADIRACAGKGVCALWSFRFGVLPTTFRRVIARQRYRRQTLLLPGL